MIEYEIPYFVEEALVGAWDDLGMMEPVECTEQVISPEQYERLQRVDQLVYSIYSEGCGAYHTWMQGKLTVFCDGHVMQFDTYSDYMGVMNG